jgi:1-acyl-sn-glycerol-3-phosphate acyltransferase
MFDVAFIRAGSVNDGDPWRTARWYRRWLDEFLDCLVPSVLYLYARLWHGCERSGRNTLARRGAALVIANHPSHADPAFLMAGCRRRIHFLQASEYYDVPVLRSFFHLFGCIPVKRGVADPGGIRVALARLCRGAAVGLFPEGEVTPSGADRLRQGRTGAALLALRSGVPVIPAFIAGTPPPRGVVADWIWHARGVRVFLGPPIDLTPYYGLPLSHARLREMTDLLMRRIADLRPSPSPYPLPSGERVG